MRRKAGLVLSASAKRTLFIYLGRRGALSQFVLDLARTVPDRAVLVISRQNELYADIAAAGAPVIGVDTFSRAPGAILHLPRVIAIRRRLVAALREHNIGTVVALMPHVWTPLVAPALKRAGARYILVVHDGSPHAGDATSLLHSWHMREARIADEVVTLSEHVARQLVERAVVPAARVHALFHPLLGAADARRIESAHDRLAFLFIGRMLYYKGLPLFVEACEILRQEGLPFGIGVVGHGDIEAVRERLVSCGAEIANRWIPHGEVAPLLARYDAVVIPSIAASQSGGVALAHGHGLPAIVTPVGGLVEQVKDGTTGLIAASVSAADVAAQMRRFLLDPDLRRRLAEGVRAEQEARSMRRFVDEIERLAANAQATSSS